MPDIIDLLSSSPELPIPRATERADLSPSPKPLLPSKSLKYTTSDAKDGNYINLSSDSVGEDAFLPPRKPVSSASNRSPSPKPISNMSTTQFRPLRKSIVPEKTFFNSDDFNSTVNLDDDDPFASDQPSAKRQRLSPPPNPSMITRSPGYRGWISRLEDSRTCASEAGSLKQTTEAEPSTQERVSSNAATLKTIPGSSTVVATRTSGYGKPSSDIAVSRNSAAPQLSTNGLQRSKAMSTVLELDPIIFTSSPDPVADARIRKQKQKKANIDVIFEVLSDNSIFDSSPREAAKGETKSISTELDVALQSSPLHYSDFESSDIDLPDLGAISSQPNPKTSVKNKASGRSTAMVALNKYEAQKSKEKMREAKERMTKAKLAAKEAEKETKRVAKEEKVKERDRAAELAKVNILRTDKKKSTPEMIVDLPSCLDKRLMEQIQTFLQPVEAQHSQYETENPILKWRRKIDSEFDKEADHWEKVKPYIGREKHVMCIMKALEFVNLATGEEGRGLDTHVLGLKAMFTTEKIIYLIEGLEPWMRKNKNLQNRKFVQEVRNQNSEEAVATTIGQSRKKRREMNHVDEDLVEDALLKLQVVYGVLIHHTKVQIETAEWVVIFTQHISTVRYRIQKQSLDTAFCMESGQVKTGEGPADTFTKMLQEMVRITASVAYGIAAEYPTVQRLVKGLRENGPLALQDCKKSANKDGAFTDRRVGPSISKRVYNVFMCRDVESWDV